MVVTIMSALVEQDFFIPAHLVKDYIIPACISASPVQDDPIAQSRLRKTTETIANPEPLPVPPLPKIAARISNRTYVFDPNPSPFKTISMAFEDEADEANLSLAFGPRHIHVAVGLDGIYRITRSEDHWRVPRIVGGRQHVRHGLPRGRLYRERHGSPEVP
jgi:hypothetical protein